VMGCSTGGGSFSAMAMGFGCLFMDWQPNSFNYIKWLYRLGSRIAK